LKKNQKKLKKKKKVKFLLNYLKNKIVRVEGFFSDKINKKKKSN
jgi:hypothetical protein